MVFSMLWRRTSLMGLLALVSLLGNTGSPRPAVATEPPKPPLPKFAAIQEAFDHYFASLRDHQPLDFINQNDFDAALKAVETTTGWVPQDIDKLRNRVLAPDSFIAKELDSPDGKLFQRQIGPLPLGYDRLDRLSKLQYGEIAVHRLIYTGRDGYKLIQYMTTASGGKEMGVMLSRDPKGENFNAPTGRIYTSQALLTALKASYDAQATKHGPPAAAPRPALAPQQAAPQPSAPPQRSATGY